MRTLERRAGWLSALSPLGRIRAVACLLDVLAAGGTLGQLDRERPVTLVLAAAACVLALVTLDLCTVALRRTLWPTTWLAGPLVMVVGGALVDPMATVGVLVSLCIVQALYGSGTNALLRVALLLPVMPVVIAVTPRAHLPWNSSTVLFMCLIPGMVTALIRTLRVALETQAEFSHRDGLIAATSRRLLGCTDPAQVAAVAAEAWRTLCDLTPGLVILRAEPGIRRGELTRTVTGDAVPGDRRHWATIGLDDEGAGEQRGGTVLHVGLDRRIPPSLLDSIATMDGQFSMAASICEAYAELSHRAQHDALTGMPNRALLSQRLTRVVEDVHAHGTSAAVMVIDLDDFKTVNDSLGHLAGDELLVEIARRMTEVVGEAGTAARFGGDEFAVLLPRLTGPDQAAQIAAQLLEQLLAPVALAAGEVTVGASIGLVISDVGATAADLLKRADVAMYEAKAAGKNRVAIFSDPTREAAQSPSDREAAVNGASA